jgi:hypothetical protein
MGTSTYAGRMFLLPFCFTALAVGQKKKSSSPLSFYPRLSPFFYSAANKQTFSVTLFALGSSLFYSAANKLQFTHSLYLLIINKPYISSRFIAS